MRSCQRAERFEIVKLSFATNEDGVRIVALIKVVVGRLGNRACHLQNLVPYIYTHAHNNLAVICIIHYFAVVRYMFMHVTTMKREIDDICPIYNAFTLSGMLIIMGWKIHGLTGTLLRSCPGRRHGQCGVPYFIALLLPRTRNRQRS